MAFLSEAKGRMMTLLVGAFGFVAALQWNEAIKKWMEPLTAHGGGAVELTGVAVLVTLIAIIAIFFVGKALKE